MSSTSRSSGAAKRARSAARSSTGARSSGSMPLGMTVDLGLVDPEDVGDVAVHVVRADDDAVGAARHPALDAVDVATAGACRPSPGGGRTRWRGSSSGTAARRRRRARRRAAATSQSWPWTTSKRSARAERAAGREHVRRSCPRPRRRTRRGRAASAARDAVDAHARARPRRRRRARAAREDVDLDALRRTSASESLRTWRARPPSTIGGYSQERIRTRGPRACASLAVAGFRPFSRLRRRSGRGYVGSARSTTGARRGHRPCQACGGAAWRLRVVGRLRRRHRRNDDREGAEHADARDGDRERPAHAGCRRAPRADPARAAHGGAPPPRTRSISRSPATGGGWSRRQGALRAVASMGLLGRFWGPWA